MARRILLALLLLLLAAPPAHALTPDEARSFVTSQYQELLGREPDGSLEMWVAALAFGGMTPEGFVSSVTHSWEYANRVVRFAYRSFLGREPSGGDLVAWATAMVTGQLSAAQVNHDIMSSLEAQLYTINHAASIAPPRPAGLPPTIEISHARIHDSGAIWCLLGPDANARGYLGGTWTNPGPLTRYVIGWQFGHGVDYLTPPPDFDMHSILVHSARASYVDWFWQDRYANGMQVHKQTFLPVGAVPVRPGESLAVIHICAGIGIYPAVRGHYDMKMDVWWFEAP